jgi:hypothetical protein
MAINLSETQSMLLLEFAEMPTNPRMTETSSNEPILRLLGGQELILDPVRAGPGGWSVRAGAEGTQVFTSSLDGWTYFEIPPR